MVSSGVVECVDLLFRGDRESGMLVHEEVVGAVNDPLLVTSGTHGEGVAQQRGDFVRTGHGFVVEMALIDDRCLGSEVVGQQPVVSGFGYDVAVVVDAAGIGMSVAQVAFGGDLTGCQIVEGYTEHFGCRVVGFDERGVVESRRDVLDLLVDVDPDVVRIAGVHERTAFATGRKQGRREQGGGRGQ